MVNIKVLLIDDEKMVNCFLGKSLRLEGFDVIPLDNAEEASFSITLPEEMVQVPQAK